MLTGQEVQTPIADHKDLSGREILTTICSPLIRPPHQHRNSSLSPRGMIPLSIGTKFRTLASTHLQTWLWLCWKRISRAEITGFGQ